MSDRVVDVGDKLHIMTRRLFQEDVRRHFAGEVVGVSGELVEVQGFSFIFHTGMNEYRRNPEIRTRIFSLGEAVHIVNKLPREVDVGSLNYEMVANRLVVTDRRNFRLDINEFGPSN